MRTFTATVLLCFLAFSCLWAADPGIRFVQNDGQWDASVRYRADLPGGFLLLKDRSLHYVFYDAAALAALHDGKAKQSPIRTALSVAPPAGLRAHGIEVTLEGASTAARLEGLNPDDVVRSYFHGNARAGNVPAYGEIWYRQIYPGVDLRLYTAQATLKYEFIVAPGTSPSVIRMRYAGADGIGLENGNLTVKHSLGRFQEYKPYCYQEVKTTGARPAAEVPGAFRVQNDLVTFDINAYDSRQPLVIDPVLIFSTYSGSTIDNWGHTATYDDQGNLYSGGSALGVIGFPATVGAYQVRGGGTWDTAILKYSADGTRLLYATYLGGISSDIPHSLMVNSKGELVIFGTTSSRDFPTSLAAYDRSFNGGIPLVGGNDPVGGMDFENGSDIFLAKLSADGSQLLASTYFGGSGNDGLNLNQTLTIRNYGDAYRGEVVIGPDDDVYVASVTQSGNLPTGALSGGYDALVLRFNAELSVLKNAVVLGGTGYDAASGIRVGASGSVYVCGATASSSFKSTSSGFKSTLTGTEDGFVARLRFGTAVNVLTDSRFTYLGTSSADVAQLLDLDAAENVYVLGLTTGRYTVTAGTYQNPGSGQFIQALDKDLVKSIFSTVIGSGRSSPDIVPTAFLVSECGNLYLSGWGGVLNEYAYGYYSALSSTKGLPVTSDAFRSTTDGNNFYLMMLESGAKSLLYATFFGSNGREAGDHVDGGTCRFDKRGFIYHAACACNRPGSPSNFTTTPGVWSRSNPSPNCNNAAFKFDIDRLAVSFDYYQGAQKDTVTGCLPITLRFVNTSSGGKTYAWDIAGLAKSSSGTEVSYTFDKPGTYTVKLTGTNALSCQREAAATRTIVIKGTEFSVRPDTTICQGSTVQLWAKGGVSYQWNASPTISTTTVANPTAQPTASTSYTVQLTDAQGCKAQRTVNVTIDDSFRPDVSVQVVQECGQSDRLALRLNNAVADAYSWLMGNGDSLRGPQPGVYQYPQPGTYTVTVQARRGSCVLNSTIPVTVEPPLTVPNVVTPNNDGRNDTFDVGRRGLKLDVYNRWGKLLYQSDDYPNTWGPGTDQGVYYYLLTTPSGAKCKGWVEVLK